MEPRSKKGIFIGYPAGVKGYKVWYPDPKSPKSVISRDVVFDESVMLHQKKEPSNSSETSVKNSSEQVENKSSSQNDSQSNPVQLSTSEDAAEVVVSLPVVPGIELEFSTREFQGLILEQKLAL